MHSFFENYGSLLMGLVIAFGGFVVGMVSIRNDEVRRTKLSGAKDSFPQDRGPANVRR